MAAPRPQMRPPPTLRRPTTKPAGNDGPYVGAPRQMMRPPTSSSSASNRPPMSEQQRHQPNMTYVPEPPMKRTLYAARPGFTEDIMKTSNALLGLVTTHNKVLRKGQDSLYIEITFVDPNDMSNNPSSIPGYVKRNFPAVCEIDTAAHTIITYCSPTTLSARLQQLLLNQFPVI